MSLKLRTRVADGVMVVYCLGQLVAGDEVSQLRTIVKSLLPENNKIVLNVQNLEYTDSAGIGSFASLCASVRRSGGDLKFCAPSPRVRYVLQLTRLTTVFEIFDREDEALAAFRRPGPTEKSA